MASRQTNTPDLSKEDGRLLLYRMEQVESGVKQLHKKFDARDNITRADLNEFKDAIFERIADFKSSLEKEIADKADKTQLDNLTETVKKKADQSQVDDLRSLVKWAGGFLSTVIAALVIFYLTNK